MPPTDGRICAAVGGAEEFWIEVPATAAHYPARAIVALRSRTAIAWDPSIAVVPAVLSPLPDVAMDVVKPPGVWLEAVDGHRVPAIFPLGSETFVRLGTAVVVGLGWGD